MKLSNNVLSILLGFAILFSIAGTWMSISYIDSLNLLTGKATDTASGTTQLTVASATSCSAVDNAINFGTMARSTSNTSEIANDFITIQNDGNLDANVTVYATEELWDSAGYQTPSDYWMIHCNASESGTCNTTYLQVPNTDGNMLVTNLDSLDTIDLLTVGVNVTVPADEPAGAKSGTLLFTCTTSG